MKTFTLITINIKVSQSDWSLQFHIITHQMVHEDLCHLGLSLCTPEDTYFCLKKKRKRQTASMSLDILGYEVSPMQDVFVSM